VGADGSNSMTYTTTVTEEGLTGPLWVGTPLQELKVFYDIGRDWIGLKTAGCTLCNSIKLDSAASTTFETSGTSEANKVNGVTYAGLTATDTISLDSSGTT